MPRPSTRLQIGDMAPAFTLTDAISGATLTLDSLLRDRAGVLLAFHRGMWCPNCRGQLAELQDSAPRWEEKGMAVAGVLAQHPDRIAAALGQRGLSYPFPLLGDSERKVVRDYGVWHRIGVASWNTAHPACFLIDSASRRLRYAFVGSSQSERAPLDTILESVQ